MSTAAPRTFVVFKCRAGTRNVWAWCVWGSGPGFGDIFYTEADGFTAAEIEAPPNLDEWLFTVTEAVGREGG